MLWIDHVALACADLDVAAAHLLERHGLASVPGGRHPGWGTANRIVPLGGSYVELITVVDAEEALQSQFGTAVRTKLADGGDHLFAWCLASDGFDAEIARLRLPAAEGSRQRPDGQVVRWRSAGLPAALDDPSLPFFISWEIPDELHPGAMAADHRERPTGIAWVEVRGDASQLRDWLGGAEVPVQVREGPDHGILALGIATHHGEVVLT